MATPNTDAEMATRPMHELSFFVRGSTTINVNGLEPDVIMAWLLHHADMAGDRDAGNRKRFLDAARELANVYSYTPLAKRIQAIQ